MNKEALAQHHRALAKLLCRACNGNPPAKDEIRAALAQAVHHYRNDHDMTHMLDHAIHGEDNLDRFEGEGGPVHRSRREED